MFDKKAYMKNYMRTYQPIYYHKNKVHTIAQVTKTRNARRHQNRQRAIEMAGGCCIKCGYNKCVAALEFHHPDPSQKDGLMSRLWTKKWATIEQTIKVCQLLCANCHREKHWARGQTG